MSAPGRLVVVWRITEACDLDCWFCEYARRHGGRRAGAKAEDVLAFGASLADYAKEAGREVLVSWLGGEPLLWPPLRRVGQALHEAHGLLLAVTTNGTRLGAAGMADDLARHYAEVTISVDGPAELHDAGRGAPGLHARVRAGVGALREATARQGHGPRLRANLLLMRASLPVFEATCHTVADWGIEEITFNALGGRPPGARYGEERLRPAEVDTLRAALPGIRQGLEARGVRLLGASRYTDRLAHQAAGWGWPEEDCRPGDELIFVDERGRAAPCAFTGDGYGVPIAEIQTAGEVARLPARYHARRANFRMDACGDCLSTQLAGKFAL